MPKKKIAIIDDHVLFLTGISELIKKEFEVELEIFSRPKEFLSNNMDDIDLLITDIEMDEVNGIQLIGKLRERNTKYPILVVTMHNKVSIIKKCRQMDVEGYLLKDDSNSILIEAIKEIFEGRSFYSDQVLSNLDKVREYDKSLTPREEEIIRLIAQGMDSNEIANTLFISINTAKTHRRNLKSKLGLESTADIVKYAIDNFIIDKDL